jgi:hypothetical protein
MANTNDRNTDNLNDQSGNIPTNDQNQKGGQSSGVAQDDQDTRTNDFTTEEDMGGGL